MPKKFSAAFKRDVVAVARRGQLTRAEIASEFGGSETRLRRWLKQADVDEGLHGVTRTEQDELSGHAGARGSWSRRRRSCGVPRHIKAYYAKDALPMTHLLVRDLAADGVPVGVTCRVLGVSSQAYSADWRIRQSARDRDDTHLADTILDTHGDDPTFGYRFIADELEHASVAVGENRVQRLCLVQRPPNRAARRRQPTRTGRPRRRSRPPRVNRRAA